MPKPEKFPDDEFAIQRARLSAVAAALFPVLACDIIVRNSTGWNVTLFLGLRAQDGKRYAMAFPLFTLVQMNNAALLEAVRAEGIRLGLLTQVN